MNTVLVRNINGNVKNRPRIQIRCTAFPEAHGPEHEWPGSVCIGIQDGAWQFSFHMPIEDAEVLRNVVGAAINGAKGGDA